MTEFTKPAKSMWLIRLVISGILLCLLFLADFVVGTFYETSVTRETMGVFRSEVAPLSTTTNHLIPNLSHEYLIEDKSISVVRTVRTDEYGIMKGASADDYTSATKILFLGGSTTENNEVDEPYRFPYLVGALLNKTKSQKFYGVNAGIRAHTTQDSLNLYLNHPSPDISNAEIVVVMHNINDRLHLTLSDSFKSDLNQNSTLTLSGVIDNFYQLVFSTWNWVKFKSNIIFLIDINWDKLSLDRENKGIVINEEVLGKMATLTDKQVDLFSQNIRLLVRIIRAREKIPILMTQPLGKDSKGQSTFNDAIRKTAKTEKVYLVDLAN